MTRIARYTTFLEAELARLLLERQGIPAQVSGVHVGLEGGGAGVQLAVPDAVVDTALRVLAGN